VKLAERRDVSLQEKVSRGKFDPLVGIVLRPIGGRWMGKHLLHNGGRRGGVIKSAAHALKKKQKTGKQACNSLTKVNEQGAVSSNYFSWWGDPKPAEGRKHMSP